MQEKEPSEYHSGFMHTPASILTKIACFAVTIVPWSKNLAQNQTVTGDLTVNGSATVLNGPFSLGVASFNGGSSLAGLTIAYDDIAQTGSGGSYVPGQSTIYQLAAQALAEFHWQYSHPTTGDQDLMLLSNDVLSVIPSINGAGTANVLPNQTLNAGGTSILTKTLADGLYLSSSGGTITGNVTITGSANIGTLSANLTGQGTDNRLPNQVANHANSILTRGIADGLYMSSGYDAGIPLKFGVNSYAAMNNSIALGHNSSAAINGVVLGSYSVAAQGATAIGYTAYATEQQAIALGSAVFAAGIDSIAIGINATTTQAQSIAIGRGAQATLVGQISLGSFNQYQTSTTSISSTDPLFIIGNGTADNARSNAFVIRRNGDTEVKGNLHAVGTDNRLPNQVANHANSILTKGIGDELYMRSASGGPGIPLQFGYNSAVTAGSSIALGHLAKANEKAISIGSHAGDTGGMASGEESVALGFAARAIANNSVAVGAGTWSGGDYTVTLGSQTGAHAHQSIAIGRGSQAYRKGQVVLGNFNVLGTVQHSPDPTDYIFVLGNGNGIEGDPQRYNDAFTIQRDGKVQVTGELTVASNLSVQGTDNRLPNQVVNHATSILTKGIADQQYVAIKDAGSSFIYGNSAVVEYTGIALGSPSQANTNAISIGHHAGHMGWMASAPESVSIGYQARAPGERAVSLGMASWAAGIDSFAVNTGAARAARTVAIGVGSEATRPGQVVLGNFNEYPFYSESVIATDNLFIIGNGTADNARSNAFVIKRNGDVEVKGSSLTVNGHEVLTQADAVTTYVTQSMAATDFIAKDTTDGRLPNQIVNNDSSILTRSAADARYLHLESDGRSMKLGDETQVTLSYGGSSIALGHRAKANLNAISIGGHANYYSVESSGINSIAIGDGANSPGASSIGLGAGTYPNGEDAIAIGRTAASRTTQSITLGVGAESRRPGQIVIGNFNAHDPYVIHTADPTDNLFVIGNGTDGANRSNAFVIKRNGDVEVKGTSLTLNGVEVMTASSASSTYLTLANASSIYLTSTAAAAQYVTKIESEDFLTSADFATLQADIDDKIDPDELEAALENLTLGGGTGNYLSKDPAIGLAYGTGSSATASSSVALGESVVATRQGEVVVGRHNEETGAGTPTSSDPVFVIGAGSGETGQPGEKKNAFVVRRDGNIHVNGVLRVRPAGNLSMEGYEDGPKPGAEE